jgi:hypothetical protein
MLSNTDDNRTTNQAKPEHNNTLTSDHPPAEATPHPKDKRYARTKTEEAFRVFWDTMSVKQRLEVILLDWPASQWFDRDALHMFALVYADKDVWGFIKAQAKERGVNPFDLEKAVQHVVERHAKAYPRPTVQGTLSECATDGIAEADVEWLWWPYLPLGAIVMLDGEPGVGKSLLTLCLAAAISRGWPLPDQEGKPTLPTGDPGTTLLLSCEDSLSQTIKPRLVKAGADCSKVIVVTGWKRTPDGEDEPFTFAQLPLLAGSLEKHHPRLVIIDPIQAYLGGKVDINRSNETRPLLAALARFAEKYRCAIVLVRHPAKAGMGSAIHRGLGSIDFIGAARSALFVAQHPLHPDQALLCHSKSNLGPLGRTLTFTKGEEGFHWQAVSRLDAETLAGGKRGPNPQEFLEATLWLEQRLSGGLPWPAKDILDEGEEEGHSKKLLYKAKTVLGVVSRQLTTGWTWRLPDIPVILSPSSPSHTGVSGGTGETGVTGETGRSDLDTGDDETPSLDTPGPPDLPVSPVSYARAREASDASMKEAFDSALCPEGGRHSLIPVTNGWRCIRCFDEASRHPGCEKVGTAHTLAIRDGKGRTKERYCNICQAVTETWEV